LAFRDEGGVPTVRVSLDGEAFDLPEERPVDENPDVADARKIKALLETEFEPGLWISMNCTCSASSISGTLHAPRRSS